MNILILGGTRLVGVKLVELLVKEGHNVSIATRGKTIDNLPKTISRIIVDRTNYDDMYRIFSTLKFDIVFDNIAYCSNDIKSALDNIVCKRYILISSSAVYNLHINTSEDEFAPEACENKWKDRGELSYAQGKRGAETALFTQYIFQNKVAVRFPFIISENDYTKRLEFYTQRVVKGEPLWVDNLSAQMSFITDEQAAKFLVHIASTDFEGSINACCSNTISIKEILQYIEDKTQKTAILCTDGAASPYNGTNAYSLNTSLAQNTNFEFCDIKPQVFAILDNYVELFC